MGKEIQQINKINDYINILISFIKDGQEKLGIDVLKKEIIIILCDSDKPNIYFINYENNKKELKLRYRPDWDYNRVALLSVEYDTNGNEIINKKQKDEKFDCLYYSDSVFESIESIILFLYDMDKYDKRIKTNKNNKLLHEILNTNNINLLHKIVNDFNNYNHKYVYQNEYKTDYMIKLLLC